MGNGTRIKALGTVFATAVAALVAAGPAFAGHSYTVISCSDGQGHSQLSHDNAGGWTFRSNTPNSSVSKSDACSNGGPLTATLLGSGAPQSYGSMGEESTWGFVAPPNTSINTVHLDFAGDAPWPAGANSSVTSYFEIFGAHVGVTYECGACGSVGRRSIDFNGDAGETLISLSARCFDYQSVCGASGNAYEAQAQLYGSAITMEDDNPPSIGIVSGGAIQDQTWKANEPLTFNASDQGGGVHEMHVKVDGVDEPDLAQVIGDKGDGECAGNVTAYGHSSSYGSPRPCLLTTNGQRLLDTTKIPEGQHQIEVIATDVTGDPSTVYEASKFVDNIPAPTNTGAPAIAGTPSIPHTLVGSAGTWDDHGASGDPRYTYQWERCDGSGQSCQAIAGEVGAAHDLISSDAFHTLRFVVTATDSEGTASAPSHVSAVIADANGNTTAPGGTGTATPSGSGVPVTTSPTATPGGSQPSFGGSTSTPVPEDRGVLNGDNGSDVARLSAWFAGNKHAVIATRYGQRATVRGRLVDGSGDGIRNAKIELLATNAAAGSATIDKGGARTRSDGTWTLIMPSNASSRALTFRYRSHLGDTRPIASLRLTLRVHAGLTLKVTPRASRNGGTIRFTGRLRGGPVPSGGKLVELQARGAGGGHWITFKTLRSSSAGHFNARYTFKRTFGRVTYQFRARSRQEGSYPYLAGSSPIASVRVN